MNGIQIVDAIQKIPNLSSKFKGCFLNNNLPYDVYKSKESFFIVNTLTQPSNKIGHWLLFYKINHCLFFFDSFSLEPLAYGGEISKFFNEYPYHKILGTNHQVQNESSYVCGAYTIFFASMMSNGYSLEKINSTFTKNTTKKNDLIVTNFLYSSIGIELSCDQNFCPSIVFSTRCRNFCCCV